MYKSKSSCHVWSRWSNLYGICVNFLWGSYIDMSSFPHPYDLSSAWTSVCWIKASPWCASAHGSLALNILWCAFLGLGWISSIIPMTQVVISNICGFKILDLEWLIRSNPIIPRTHAQCPAWGTTYNRHPVCKMPPLHQLDALGRTWNALKRREELGWNFVDLQSFCITQVTQVGDMQLDAQKGRHRKEPRGAACWRSFEQEQAQDQQWKRQRGKTNAPWINETHNCQLAVKRDFETRGFRARMSIYDVPSKMEALNTQTVNDYPTRFYCAIQIHIPQSCTLKWVKPPCCRPEIFSSNSATRSV